ncbi:MAG: hypothetical protein NTZ48_04400, partial [Candidatus Omnitrophica bacterium]|nr:hypothetical protein [Candidatus Omnitrophota bacterium]
NRLLRVVEEKKQLFDILSRDMEEEGIKVHIGEENPLDEIKSLSFVTANYKLNGQVIGSLGILGPTRMAYAHVASIVDYISEVLEKTLGKKGF